MAEDRAPQLEPAHGVEAGTIKNRLFRQPKDWLELLLFTLAAFLLCWHLGNYALWGDEAETAIYAKGILRAGLPIAWDGRNLFEYGGNLELNRDMLNAISGWLQFYVVAGSFALFGLNEWAGRLPFVVAALASAAFTYAYARRRYDRSVALVALLLTATNVQWLLFARQVRYYALSYCLMSCLVWLYDRSPAKPRWVHYVGFVIVECLLIFTHPISAAAALAAWFLVAFVLDDRRKALLLGLIPLGPLVLIAGAFFAWLYRFGGPPSEDPLFSNLSPVRFLKLFWLHLQDYSIAGFFPAGLLAAWLVAVVASKRWNKRGVAAMRLRNDLMLVAVVLVFTLLLAIGTIQPPNADHSSLRYAAPMFPLLLVLSASVLVRCHRLAPVLGIALTTLVVFTNVLSFDKPVRSYLAEYIGENVRPFPNAARLGVQMLANMVQQDDTVLVAPNFMRSTVMFYLGDRVLVLRAIDEQNEKVLPYHPELPGYTYSCEYIPKYILAFGFLTGPSEEHIQDFLGQVDFNMYDLYANDRVGEDFTRAELWWRSFTPLYTTIPNQKLSVFKLKN